ncbi:MAG: NADH-quinone oxidoreductase subunit J [Ignavibacteriales bacterium]|nr:NADH-quinone oxidoreductase subunit J [Ignavibacteriaceae bacterium]QOJ29308.1 MAG: NADH-quinone oxidoreductase subunit J [Ignavibacteriales bacterium]
MTYYSLVFWLFALITVGSAFIVVMSKNLIYSVFALMLTFFGVAGLYVLLSADFIAIVQLIVYVGGILIVLIFGVMLTNSVLTEGIKNSMTNLLLGSIATGALAGLLILLFTESGLYTNAAVLTPVPLKEISRLFIVDYLVLFELLGVLLLAALIGAASIGRKEKI